MRERRGRAGRGKGLFGIFRRPAEGEEVEETVKGEGDEGEKVVIFAPGALYEVLPLWVAEGSECEGELPFSIPSDTFYTYPSSNPRSTPVSPWFV